MANQKITDLTELTSVASGDKIEIVDVSDTSFSAAGTNKFVTQTNFIGSIQTTSLSVSGLNASELLRVNSGGTAIESSGKTVPTGDIVGTTDTQTLTNKTMTTAGNTFDSASLTAEGMIEIATAAETTTGTDAGRAVSPDGLAGSDFGKRMVAVSVFGSGTAVSTGDGTVGIPITSELNGYNIVDAQANVYTKGVTGTTDVQIRRQRGATDADVLSTKITIGDEYFASDGVVNTSNDDLATGDMLFVDVDAVHSGTAPNGLSVSIVVQLP